MNSILKATRSLPHPNPLPMGEGRVRARSKGFTLVEIMIVLAVLAVMAAVVIPNISGFLGRGKERAFDSDRRILQAGVDTWRTDVSARGGNPWPTISGSKGAITTCASTVVVDTIATCASSPVIKISLLTTGNYLKGNDVVRSFAYSTPTDTGATNSIRGSYVWYADANGLVQGRRWTPASTPDTTVNANELAATDGYDSTNEIYP